MKEPGKAYEFGSRDKKEKGLIFFTDLPCYKYKFYSFNTNYNNNTYMRYLW